MATHRTHTFLFIQRPQNIIIHAKEEFQQFPSCVLAEKNCFIYESPPAGAESIGRPHGRLGNLWGRRGSVTIHEKWMKC
jgi:hypothetical protein